MIIERKILESKTVSLKIPLPGPGNAGYRTVKISLPSKIRYKLHRHSLSKVSGTEGLGTYMAGVVDGYIVWDSRYSCGLTSSVTWEIPDLSELTVDHATKVTSVTTTKIQGKTRRYKSSTSVSQKQKASVSLNRSKLTLYVGKSSRLTAKIQGASKKAVWRSSKPSVASVTSKGLVKGKKAGTAVITAKANGKTAKCTVTVKRKNSSSQNKAGSTELSGLLNLTMRSAAKRLKIAPIQETSYGNFAYGKKIYAYEYGKRIYYYSFQMYSEKGDADKKGAWRIEGALLQGLYALWNACGKQLCQLPEDPKEQRLYLRQRCILRNHLLLYQEKKRSEYPFKNRKRLVRIHHLPSQRLSQTEGGSCYTIPCTAPSFVRPKSRRSGRVPLFIPVLISPLRRFLHRFPVLPGQRPRPCRLRRHILYNISECSPEGPVLPWTHLRR